MDLIRFPPLTPRGKQAAELYMAAFDGEQLALENIDAFGLIIVTIEDEMAAIMSLIMQQGGPLSRAMAAATFLLGMEQYPEKCVGFEGEKSTAIQIFTSLLKFDEITDIGEFACEIMAYTGQVPPQVVPLLQKLLKHHRPMTRVSAAAAMARADVPCPEAFYILSPAADESDLQLVRIAAFGLFYAEVHSKRAIEAMCKVFREGKEHERQGVIVLLRNIGPRAIDALPLLESVFADVTQPDYVRGKAVAAIGSVTRESVHGLPLLLQALAEDNWEVLLGATEGLQFCDHYPQEAVEILINRLEHPDAKVRQAAARGIRRFGRHAIDAAPEFIRHLMTEEDEAVISSMIDAVGYLGEGAFPFLMNEIRAVDFRAIFIVSLSMLAIGKKAIPHLVEFAEDFKENEQATATIILILREMGMRGTPVVPALAGFLDQASSADMACIILDAIRSCHVMAAMATEAIVRSLVVWDNQMVEYHATRILRDIGQPAVVALETALANSEASTKDRLQYAIAVCRPRVDKRFSRFDQFNRDDVLRLFAHACDYLKSEGEARSWKEIATVLDRKTKLHWSNGREMRINDRNVANAVKEVSGLCEHQLTTHRPGISGELTPHGNILLQEVKEYLWSKYEREWDKPVD